jgi:cysteinyl-tRNA synthetase
MSKSLGNLVTIKEFLSQHDPDVLRMMVLNSSYRSPLTFNDDVISQAERALERLRQALRPVAMKDGSDAQPAVKALDQQVDASRQGFLEAMDDDFNTAGALGYLFDLVRAINQGRDLGVDAKKLGEAQDVLRELSGVLGLQLERASTRSSQADPYVDLLLEVRGELRRQKLWALSDLIRDRLAALNVVLEDTKDGSAWRWK